MKIKISGGNAHQRKNVESLVEFCSDKLMSKRLANSIKLDIRLSRTYLKTHGDYGCCEWQDDCHRPKEFKMWVDSAQNPREFYSTVAHEMVHLKQFAKGELTDLMRSKKIKWSSASGLEYYDFDREDDEYWDLPWEIEARGREEGLVVRWIDHADLKDSWVYQD
tara:strand:+ start:10 stop:501 length:492 start_codon:yes stop_codon:yes gene_type:complete